MNKINFNRDWTFQKCGSENVQNVCLPHDAMLYEKRDPNCKNGKSTGYFPGGKYIYSKKFIPDNGWKDLSVILMFEGVYGYTTVIFNGEKVCEHPYGYTEFYIDLTDKLVFGIENTVQVIADNSGEPCSRWYCGSGIYRPVWLYTGNKKHIPLNGVSVQTVSYDPAVLRVITEADGEISVSIYDGKQLIANACGKDVTLHIPNAKLWSADNPYLYECRTELKESGKTVDTATLNCGICKIEWSTAGLFINGKETKLRGACIHHDNGILGACEYPEAAMRRVRILKEAGYNAIRSAHNPCSRALLDACDKIGMFVMDEFTDMWYEHKNRYDYASHFMERYLCDLTAMIKKDYYHPSVIMYSIGNEVTETKDELGITLTGGMTEIVHSYDMSRPVTCGINMALNVMNFAGLGVYKPEPGEPPKIEQRKNPEALKLLAEQMKNTPRTAQSKNNSLANMQSENGAKTDGKLVGSEYFNAMMLEMKERQRTAVTQPVAKILSEEAYAKLDIAGYNYADGRYYLDKEEYPNRVSVGTETLPQRIAKNWKAVKELPYIIGDFMWTGWDYIGEAGVGSFCYDSVGTKDKEYPALLAGSGTIDILGNPRPEIQLNKAVFGLSKLPYIGVEPVTHSHENRLISAWRVSDAVHSWSWEGCEGKKAEIIVYADAAEIELILNGTPLGRKYVEEYQAKFETIYQSGTLEAVAYDEAGKEIGRDVLTSAGKETIISVTAEETNLKCGGIAYLNISVTDKNGVVKCANDTEIFVEVSGNGKLLAFGNANPFNEQSYVSNMHRTYYGRAQAVVRAGYGTGDIIVSVSADGCKKVELKLNVKE